MKGQMRTTQRVMGVLLVSAALGFAQANRLSAPAQSGEEQGPNDNGQVAQSAYAVGPGTINYVEGAAELNGNALSAAEIGKVGLQPGQVLETQDGYVEVLLTPGAFLRIGHNSTVRLTSASLADTRVEFLKGSGMLEVNQLIKGTGLAVNFNSTSMEIDKKGLYTFDGGIPAYQVLDGKATVTEAGKNKTIGKNKQIALVGDGPLKVKGVDKNQIESQPLYVWSKARSGDQAQANFMAANNPSAYSASAAGWYWDPYFNSYGFWPMAGSLYSPFGFGFYSPAYFGFYGGFPGYGFYGRPAWYGRPGGWNGRPPVGVRPNPRPSGVRPAARPGIGRPGGGFVRSGGGFGARAGGARR
jgi:hypothetical protein